MDFLFNENIQFYLLAYLIGAIPFGMLLARFIAKVDVLQAGSKSIGATNVLRVVKDNNPKLAKKLAIATLVLDALKGAVIILLAKMLGLGEATQWAIAVLAVVGHCFSPYLGFEGGKGVATGMGVFLVMIPLQTLIGFLVWIICAKTIKISSVSSLLGLLAIVFAAIFMAPYAYNAPIYLVAFFIIYKHLPNLYRLFTGEEKRVV